MKGFKEKYFLLFYVQQMFDLQEYCAYQKYLSYKVPLQDLIFLYSFFN